MPSTHKRPCRLYGTIGGIELKLNVRLYGNSYCFSSVKEVLAKANEPKSGDALAGVAAENDRERVAAKIALSEMAVHDLRENPSVPYEQDSVTRIIQDDLDEAAYRRIEGRTIGEMREWMLDSATTGDDILSASRGMTSEVIAGISKLMDNLDLIYASSKIEVRSHCNTDFGVKGCFASRLQPNHPTDEPAGVLASTLEGLSYGIGDALIGLNPATDSVENTAAIMNLFYETRLRYGIPTQTCVLAHVTTQMKAVRAGAKADLCFQSIAGSEKALNSFGVSTDLLDEAQQLFLESGSGEGPNVMYFETGQASELSSDAHFGADQQTMESRCYGLARHYKPFLVNSVVGFMGPEYLYDGRQVTRAGLEDNFCARVHGLPMGCDVCYTNHMKADQNDMDNLTVLLASAGCNYVMGLPCGDDVMLMYQSNSFHDIACVRELLHLHPLPEFQAWMERMGIWQDNRLTPRAGDASLFMNLKKGAF